VAIAALIFSQKIPLKVITSWLADKRMPLHFTSLTQTESICATCALVSCHADREKYSSVYFPFNSSDTAFIVALRQIMLHLEILIQVGRD